MSHPNRSCVNCHFCQRTYYSIGIDSSTAHTSPLDSRQRSLVETNDFSWKHDMVALSCHFGVWDEGFKKPESLFAELVGRDRTDFCFFFPYHEGMLIPAAETLQDRQAKAKEVSLDRKLTIWGLWIAAIGLAVTAIVAIIDLVLRLLRY